MIQTLLSSNWFFGLPIQDVYKTEQSMRKLLISPFWWMYLKKYHNCSWVWKVNVFSKNWSEVEVAYFYLFFGLGHFLPYLELDLCFWFPLSRSWLRGLQFTCWVLLVNFTFWARSSRSVKAYTDFLGLLKKVAKVALS